MHVALNATQVSSERGRRDVIRWGGGHVAPEAEMGWGYSHGPRKPRKLVEEGMCPPAP